VEHIRPGDPRPHPELEHHPRPERRTLPETEARFVRIALEGSASLRRDLHPETGIACWALTDGSILPRDPECGVPANGWAPRPPRG
jgi:hypothetical protein